jgi:glycosyltransferase involved in cell wall biosynthesis
MQMTDTLRPGGTERVAVNLANLLPRDQYAAYLCTTREDGSLARLVAADVMRLRLNRTHRFDGRAMCHLVAFLRAQHIDIIHAHGSALFVAAAASRFPPHPAVIWHDHFGRCEIDGRPAWLYRWALRHARGVIAVNQRLADWSREELGLPADRVWYVPNFVCEPEENVPPPDLPGTPGARIVCVANFRPQKDHFTLLSAMTWVVRRVPAAHLLLVGDVGDRAYVSAIREAIARQRLEHQVSVLGQRDDVQALLRACDIGVLSSTSEGLPLALLEYGLAGLAVVATDVGQCAEVLDHGDAGLLVPSGAPDLLAEALITLLCSPERRAAAGARLRQRASDVYSPRPVLAQVARIYDTALGQAVMSHVG